MIRKIVCIKKTSIPEMDPFINSDEPIFTEGKLYFEEAYTDDYNDRTINVFRSNYPEIAYTYDFLMSNYPECFMELP